MTRIETSIVNNPNELDLPIKLVDGQNKEELIVHKISKDIEIQLTKEEKNKCSLSSKTYTDCVNKLQFHHKQVFTLILVQCTQLLQDKKFKQESTLTSVSKSYDPLDLYALIKRVVLKQTDNQYLFTSVNKQRLAVLTTKQGGLSNAQWYEHFNMRYDVAKSVGVKFDKFECLWEYCAGLQHAGAKYA